MCAVRGANSPRCAQRALDLRGALRRDILQGIDPDGMERPRTAQDVVRLVDKRPGRTVRRPKHRPAQVLGAELVVVADEVDECLLSLD